MPQPLPKLQVYDPQQDVSVVERRLPHWSQAGTITFITWRTWDSMPAHVVQRWLAECDQWLVAHGIPPTTNATATIPAAITTWQQRWQASLATLPKPLQMQFGLHTQNRWNDHLDDCHGECVLKHLGVSQDVYDSFLHFDGDRYDITDFVVMPNHVHILVAFPDEKSMLPQCDSWKHFTAAQINRKLCRTGRLWQ
ncbi:MAG: hypothetical protein U0805_05840 [Pirellulales bacterium]